MTSLRRLELKFRTILLIFIVSFTSSCGVVASVPQDINDPEPNVVSASPKDWYIYLSNGMPLHPSADSEGDWSIELPNLGGFPEIHDVAYIQTPYRSTETHNSVTITFRVDSTSPQYVLADPDDTPPASVRFFLGQRDDNFQYDQNGMWWAAASTYNLGSQDNQTLSLTVPLTPDQWTNEVGQQDTNAFASALKNIGWIGVSFGGQSFADGGVGLSGGTAKYVLVNCSIN